MVGNKHCSYGLCNSDARYSHREHMKGVFFVPFPKPQRNFARCQLWVRACGRAEFTISNIKRNSYICSKHFIGGHGPTVEHPDPAPFVATDADIRESEARGRIGRTHRKRINVTVSSSESENSQPSIAVDSQPSSSSSQYYTVLTLPKDAISGSHLPSTASSVSASNGAVVSPKLLLISQPSASKGSNKQDSLQIVQTVGTDSIPEQGSNNSVIGHSTQTLTSSGGQIVAVKNFVIHGQKYTAVHINPEGQNVPTGQTSANCRSRRKNLRQVNNGVFVSRNNLTITVPPSWSVQQDTSNLTFRRISGSDNVLLSVTFNEGTGDLILKVLGMQVTSHPVLDSLPSPVKVNDVLFILKQFEQWKVCIGNPDEKFQAVFHQRPKSSAFYSWIDDSVHSKSCELLSLKERCSACKNYRGYLRCVLNREQKKLGKASSEPAQDVPEDSEEEDHMSE